jgi:hypothetical protein
VQAWPNPALPNLGGDSIFSTNSSTHLAVAAAWPEASLAPHAALALPAGLLVSGATAAHAGAGAGGGGSSRGSSSGVHSLAGVLRLAALEELRWQELGLVLQAAAAATAAAR